MTSALYEATFDLTVCLVLYVIYNITYYCVFFAWSVARVELLLLNFWPEPQADLLLFKHYVDSKLSVFT